MVITSWCANLEESHDADDAEELEDVVLFLQVGQDEVEVERDGSDEVDNVDWFSHERQLVGTHNEPDDELEREPAVTHALDEEESLVRLRLLLVEHPHVSRHPWRRRRASVDGRRGHRRERPDAEVDREVGQRQVCDDRQSKVRVSLEAEN